MSNSHLKAHLHAFGQKPLGSFHGSWKFEEKQKQENKTAGKVISLSPEKNTEGMVKSCSGHYLPFKIITFERSENIFDVSLHLAQKKLFLDAEAKEGTLPGSAFSRCSLSCLQTGGKQQRQPVTTSQQFPHGTSLPLSTQPRDS